MPLIKRHCPAAAAYAARIEKQHNKARAMSLLAVKLGRGVYYMLRHKRPFDVETFFKIRSAKATSSALGS